MIIRCQFCETRFRIPEDKLPPAGTLVRCSSCRATFWVNPSAIQAESLAPTGELAPSPTQKLGAPGHPGGANASLDIDGFLGPPRTPPPSSIPPPKDSDSWWDLPQIDKQNTPAPQMDPPDSWFDLPEVPNTSSPVLPATQPPTAAQDQPAPIRGAEGHKAQAQTRPQGAGQNRAAQSAPQPTPAKPGSLLSALDSPSPSRPSEGMSGEFGEPSAPGREGKRRQQGAPAAPGATGPATQEEEAPSVEFLLRDRSQQRQEFWYTAVPLVVRSIFLVGFLVVFAWLWTSLEYGKFIGENLRWKRLKSTFVGPSAKWSVRRIRYQWRPLKNGRYLVIRGELLNTHKQSQREPDLTIRYAHTKVNQISQRLRCCRLPTPVQLHTLRTTAQVRRWQNNQAGGTRKQLAAGKATAFALLWVPPKGLRSIEVRVAEARHASQTHKGKQTKRPKPQDKQSDDDDDDDDDSDSED